MALAMSFGGHLDSFALYRCTGVSRSYSVTGDLAAPAKTWNALPASANLWRTRQYHAVISTCISQVGQIFMCSLATCNVLDILF